MAGRMLKVFVSASIFKVVHSQATVTVELWTYPSVQQREEEGSEVQQSQRLAPTGRCVGLTSVTETDD